MPIRINLLAEAQAAEEARRKDPAKRAVLVAVLIVSGVLLWASSLQIKLMSAKTRLGGLETQWKTMEKAYQVAVDIQRQAIDAQQKLDALSQLHSNRFLWGTTLNAFQQTLNGVDAVHVVRLRGEQNFITAEENKGRKDATASATEKVALTIEAVDSSPQPGRAQVARFKDAITQVPWFQANLQKTNSVLLTSLSAPQVGNGRPAFVLFTLQCFFPDKTR